MQGTVYLLHFVDGETGFHKRYKHAGHYLGWALDPAERIAEHRAGHGARLIQVIQQHGMDFVIARLWQNVDRNFERRLKNRGGATAICPCCHGTPAITLDGTHDLALKARAIAA